MTKFARVTSMKVFGENFSIITSLKMGGEFVKKFNVFFLSHVYKKFRENRA